MDEKEINEAQSEPSAEVKETKKTKKKSELDALREEVEKKDAELTEQKDKYLRLAAEYDNFRKRSAKERDGIYTDAVADTVNEILPVLDNLERAALYKESEKVAEGLSITAKGAAAMLSKLGIEQFGATGDTFDPNIHNAVMHIEDESLGDGEIVEVFQKGYRKGDKIIRYAMVKVAN
ncbi:MAG: nucleotide exchange factor GrpE [Clostridia bacterium]|nr:nucleotide exchange factor GrpE [Clostridia bacterium]